MILRIFSLLTAGLSFAEAIRFSLELEARPRLNRALAARQAGLTGDSEVESINDGVDFATSLLIGNQSTTLLVDTGSSDLWVLSTLVPENQIQGLGQHNFFDPNSSPTFQYVTGATFNITYDVGEIGASGIVGLDTVTVGGISLPQMPFGVTNNILGADGVLGFDHDGTMGLGWPDNQNTIELNGQHAPGPTFMTAVQPYLDEPVFTADFKVDHPKTLAFGFVNSSLYTGNLNVITVNNSIGFWALDGITFSSGTIILGPSTGVSMIMDTGGVSTTVDNQTASDYWALVQGSTHNATSNKFLFPCNTALLPDLTWTFPNGRTATLPGSTLNFTAFDSGLGDGSCIGGLQPTGNGFNNCGSPFFHTYFTVWNQAEATIGYAPYSNIDDTAGTNYGNLPESSNEQGAALTMNPPSATISATTNLKATGTAYRASTSSHHNAAVATKAPIAGIGAGAALIAGLALL